MAPREQPQDPLGDALKLLMHIREADIKKLLGNKNIASGLRQAAQGYISKRK